MATEAKEKYFVVVAVMLAAFMEVMDTAVVNVSLPHIAGNLSATVDEATWVITSYIVANAIMIPLNGWLTHYVGRKRLLMIVVSGFTISSDLSERQRIISVRSISSSRSNCFSSSLVVPPASSSCLPSSPSCRIAVANCRKNGPHPETTRRHSFFVYVSASNTISRTCPGISDVSITALPPFAEGDNNTENIK